MQANLEWFRTFKSIYETGTMSGAAKQLYISQPGVGLHLNALESYTGYPLFERTARKMIPTEKGHQLYQQVSHALAGLEDIEVRFKKKSGKDRSTLTVGMCVETFQQALEKHIPSLDFNLILKFDRNDLLTKALEKGAFDLILTSEVSNSNALSFEPFSVEKLVLVAGKNMDLEHLPDFERVSPDKVKLWLKEQIWYNTASDMGMLNSFWEHNFKEQPDFFPNYIVPNKFSIIRCLSEGGGLAVLPEFICKDALDHECVFKIWSGYQPLENMLYFGKRKQSLFMDEINQLECMLKKEFAYARIQSPEGLFS